jgi:uncharacterized membrane protein
MEARQTTLEAVVAALYAVGLFLDHYQSSAVAGESSRRIDPIIHLIWDTLVWGATLGGNVANVYSGLGQSTLLVACRFSHCAHWLEDWWKKPSYGFQFVATVA